MSRVPSDEARAITGRRSAALARQALTRTVRNAHLLVAVAVGGTLAATPLLLPSSADLGTHMLRDEGGRRARSYLERAVAEAGPERNLVLPLVQVYNHEGDYAAALKLLERLAADRNNATVADMRRTALIGAGRSWAQARELERLRRTRPNEAVLRELADLYRDQGLVELQIDALEQLLRLTPQRAELERELAWLQRTVGAQDRALQLLSGLWERQPGAFSAEDFEALAELAIALDPSDAPVRLIEAHVGAFGGSALRVTLAQRLHAAGRFDDAQRVLDPLVSGGRPDARALTTWARALVAQGRTAEAYARLRARAADGEAPEVVAGLVIALALEQGDARGALTMALDRDLQGLEPGLLWRLGLAAARLHRRAAVRRVVTRLGEQELGRDPVAATHLCIEAGLRGPALRWAGRAQTSGGLSAPQRLWLTELMLQMGRQHQAAALLRQGGPVAAEMGREPLRLALLWWRTGAPDEGLKALDALQEERGAAWRAGRALLWAAAGRVEAAWEALRADPRLIAALLHDGRRRKAEAGQSQVRAQPVQAWLQALIDVAARREHRALALLATRAMLSLDPARRELRVAVARAELAAGEPLAALSTLRALPDPLQPAEREVWRAVLLAAHRAGAPVAETLIQEAVAYLRSPGPGDANTESWVHLLLELNATRAALPFVERLAETRGGAWKGQLIALHQQLGEAREVWALWRAQGLDEREPAAARLHAANELLKGGDRGTALRIYQAVAEGEGADNSTVRQLVHLWGPRGGAEAVAWLGTRARLANGEARIGWLRHLRAVGGDEAALALIGEDAPEGALLDLRIDILVDQRDHRALAAWVSRRVAELQGAERVRHLAEHCAAHGHLRAATTAYRRLLALQADDPASLRFLAQRSADQPAAALKYWRAWFALGEARRGAATWRDHLTLGDLLMRHGAERGEGRSQLQRALEVLGGAQEPSQVRLRESGRILARLGRPSEAAPLLAQALASQPCDDALRADLVGALLATRDYEQARAAIDPPPRCGGSAQPPREELR